MEVPRALPAGLHRSATGPQSLEKIVFAIKLITHNSKMPAF
jgi:hypothetical protein